MELENWRVIQMNEDNIARLICGGEYGTAILTDSKHAVTVYHCVKNACGNPPSEIKLQAFVRGTGKEVTASIIRTGDQAEEEDEFIYLQLEEEIENIEKVRFMSCSVGRLKDINML